jgi:3-hydroxy-9,10-secoandrosta-1,3,5(10)-triene-9,17-dione monooxygenase reductase component
MIDSTLFRKVLGNYPTGVCVVTAMGGAGNPLALVIGSFTSVSLDPPLVGFLPDRKSGSWPLIRDVGHFCVNVFASDQTDLCRQLAQPGPDKFAGVPFTLSDRGTPRLEHVIAWIDCSLHDVLEAGDHYVVLGAVQHLQVEREEDPMLFFRGRYGGFRELM